MEIFETPLPGIGIRYEFDTSRGRRLGVLVQRDGSRQLLVYDKDDLDSCREVVDLGQTDAASLIELLGGSKVTERVGDLRHEVQGLSIEWLSLDSSSPMAGKAIGDGQIRTRSGASVVAVLRGDESIPGPGPSFLLKPGDTLLVTGSYQGVEAARQIILG
jgi:TrkA domain protein